MISTSFLPSSATRRWAGWPCGGGFRVTDDRHRRRARRRSRGARRRSPTAPTTSSSTRCAGGSTRDGGRGDRARRGLRPDGAARGRASRARSTLPVDSRPARGAESNRVDDRHAVARPRAAAVRGERELRREPDLGRRRCGGCARSTAWRRSTARAAPGLNATLRARGARRRAAPRDRAEARRRARPADDPQRRPRSTRRSTSRCSSLHESGGYLFARYGLLVTAPAHPLRAQRRRLDRLPGRRRRAARRAARQLVGLADGAPVDRAAVARMFDRLTTFARLIQFDRRGSGMSDRVPPAPLEEQMDDVLAVLDAAGCERRRACSPRPRAPRSPACSRPRIRSAVSSLSLFAPIPRIHRRARLPVGARPGPARDVHRAHRRRAGGRASPSTPSRPPSPATPACATGSRAWSGSRSARPRSSRRCAWSGAPTCATSCR